LRRLALSAASCRRRFAFRRDAHTCFHTLWRTFSLVALLHARHSSGGSPSRSLFRLTMPTRPCSLFLACLWGRQMRRRSWPGSWVSAS